jgi:hypothetical protein
MTKGSKCVDAFRHPTADGPHLKEAKTVRPTVDFCIWAWSEIVACSSVGNWSNAYLTEDVRDAATVSICDVESTVPSRLTLNSQLSNLQSV